MRTGLLAALALAAAALAALTLYPSRADAAFTTPQCQGADITGRGASFARDAHNVFRTDFEVFFCGSNPPAVDYEALGSGAGLEVVGARLTAFNADGEHSRDVIPRFGMTDDPPQPQEVIDINQGRDAAGDEDKIHVIPAAVGAVAPIVNFPNGCDVNRLPAAERTASQDIDGDLVPDGTVRVRFTKVKFEAAWAKDTLSDNWIELFPELRDATGFPDIATDPCNKPIIRIVRFDRSGTTFAFKDSLDTMNPTRGWIDNFTGSDNRAWPGATVGIRDDAADSCPAVGGSVPSGPGREANTIDQLTSGCSNGNGSLVSKLIATDGSIGYSDISTARGAGLGITPRATPAAGSTTTPTGPRARTETVRRPA